MKLKTMLLLFGACVCIAACNQQDTKIGYKAPETAKKRGPEEPFKYHKMIEVAPGQYYDVLSWGRGAAGGGAYMILRSDSADQQYGSTTGSLEGPIQDVLNSDLDIDGNPEIIIQAKSIDTNHYTNIFAYEYRNDNANKLDFPKLTATQRKGYRGNDNFYIKDSKLMREFPIYEGSGPAAKLSGAKRLLEYSLHSNSFSVKQMSKDSASVATNEPVAVQNKTPKKKTTSKPGSNSRSSKHHKVAAKHRAHKHPVKKKHHKRR